MGAVYIKYDTILCRLARGLIKKKKGSVHEMWNFPSFNVH